MIRHLFLVLLLLFPTTAIAESLSELVTAFESPRLGSAGLSAGGRSFSTEHLTLQFSQGKLYPVFAGERLAGVFFVGAGQMTYTSEDPYEGPFIESSVLKHSRYEMSDLSIRDSFSKVLIQTSGDPRILLQDETWPEETSPATASKAFGEHMNRWRHDRFWRADRLVPEGVIEGNGGVFVVEVQGSKHDVVYTRDPLRDGTESLAILEDSESRNNLFKRNRYPSYLSTQALGRDRLQSPPMPFTVVHLDVELTNPKARQAEIIVRERIKANQTIKSLSFNLETTIFGTVGANAALEELDYNLVSLKDGEGKPLDHSHQRDELMVQLESPLAAGQEIELQIQLEGDVLFRPNNDSYWQLGGAWYPSPFHWGMERFTYRAVVRSAAPFTPFSSGQTVRRWEEGDLAAAEFEEKHPISGPTLMAGKYKTISETRGERTVRVSSYAGNKPRAAKTLAGLVFGFIEFYEQYLGPYPFSEVNVIEINSLGFGQAPAGVIFITREAFEPRTSQATRLFSEGINARLAHEVAHAWWGHIAALSTLEDQWISEAVSDYFSAVAMSALKSENEMNIAIRQWKSGAKDVEERGTVFLGNYITGEGAGYYRHNLIYQKGPLMLHALRQELGDDPFFTILKSFQRSFPWQPARTDDFIDLTSFIAQKDMRPWFDRYLFGTDMPPIKK